jgi:hypothetical protein
MKHLKVLLLAILLITIAGGIQAGDTPKGDGHTWGGEVQNPPLYQSQSAPSATQSSESSLLFARSESDDGAWNDNDADSQPMSGPPTHWHPGFAWLIDLFCGFMFYVPF